MSNNPFVSWLGSIFGALDANVAQDDRQDSPPHDSLIHRSSDSGLLTTSSTCVIDTVIVKDRSGSMREKDCGRSRIEAGKRATEGYVHSRAAISPFDRLALVSFGTYACVHLGLTSIVEKDVIFDALKQLRAGGGTDIGEGLRAAQQLLMPGLITNQHPERIRRIILLTDGHGENGIRIAHELKERNVLIEAIGIGGDPEAVDENLLRKIATTDPDGFTHYWFINDPQKLVCHYQQLATGIVWRGTKK